MRDFGIDSSIWTIDWTPAEAEHAVSEALGNGYDVVEIALLQSVEVETVHGRTGIKWPRNRNDGRLLQAGSARQELVDDIQRTNSMKDRGWVRFAF